MKDIIINGSIDLIEKFEEFKKVHLEWERFLSTGLDRSYPYPGDEMLLIYALSVATEKYKGMMKVD